MYEVLLAVDEDEERALSQARTVADLPDAPNSVHARILHVFTDNPTGASVNQVGAARSAAESLREAGVEVTLTESSGDPAPTIVEAARENDVDAIVIAGRKRTPAGKALFGSVTQRVVLESDRPVIVAPMTTTA